jgi:hypothetical protein
MERVAFVVEETGERIDCLLNPETFAVQRVAGIRSPELDTPLLVGANRTDDPVRFTGGGRTELTIDLLFDVALVEDRTPPDDVRELTGKLWNLAENSARHLGSVRPPLVRLVWGKSWNVPGVVGSIGERFEEFTPAGAPRRSWLRIRLIRVQDNPDGAQRSFDEELRRPSNVTAGTGTAAPVAVEAQGEPGSGARLDLVAAETLGSPLRWREIADVNGIDDPLGVDPGTVLAVPAGAL